MTATGGTKVAVVTGANGGIGRHLLRGLAETGYRVAGLDVDGSAVEPLCEARPDHVRFERCDVADAGAVDDAIEAVLDEWGRVDVLVNNAAVARFRSFAAGSEADARREFDVNYFGYRNTVRAVLPQMRANGHGYVYNVSSGVALTGHPGLSGYASTKGAIEAFTRSLRLELADEGVVCSLMRPPATETAISAPLGFPSWMLFDPEDVGQKLAAKVGSTDPVVYPDLQTRAGIWLTHRFPSLWRWATDRYVRPPE